METMDNKDTSDERPYKNEKKVPDVVKEEADDKPAGKMIKWVIAIAVVLLLIIYAVFFHPADSNW
ncbi:hypothetical protein M8998_05890 [Sphingobacterium sp. lm-10]|uniref:hypothetical protein n=1 Tax=Sphingobacterium sp. lm-10 TaxID=2944904 RepID=UPI00202124F6|nr:hypothetical protein [Sphingobacterium sp. lm-10]MCL7987467.1 hypothetical protein [Sphingobacterium sp. lm-10]